MIGEFKYYELVGERIRSHGYYIGEGLGLPRDSYEEIGSLSLRIDKAGIKNLGKEDIEIAAVEIKKQGITNDIIEQAMRYYDFSHKVYAASPYKTSEDIAIQVPLPVSSSSF